MKRRAEEERKDQLRAQIEDHILKNYDFAVPASLIEKQKKEILDYRIKALSESGETPEKMIEIVTELEIQANKELNRAYRLFFIARKIAEENNIHVYEREIMNEMMHQIMLPPGRGLIDSSTDPEEAKSKLYVNVLTKKVLDFFASKATVKEE